MRLTLCIILTGCLLLLWTHLSMGLVSGACKYRKWSRPGTLKLLVIAGIHGNTNGRCEEISTTNFPLIVALDWLLDIVNGKRSNVTPYLPDIMLGYDIYDNCDDEDRTVDLLYPGFTVSNPDCPGQHDNASENIYAGIFSLTSPESTGAISRLAGFLPVLRPREPSPGLSPRAQPNLIHTVASFEDEAEALVQFLVQMKWNFVFLVYTDDEYGITTRDILTFKSRKYGICIQLEKSLKIKSAEKLVTRDSAEAIITEIYKEISRGYRKSIVVIYLGHAKGANHLIDQQKVANKPVGSQITWLFAQGVGLDPAVIHDTDFLQNYGLSVTHKPTVHDDFKNYLLKLLLNATEPLFGLKSEYLSAIDCADNEPVEQCHSLSSSSFNFLSNFVDSVILTTAMLKELHDQMCTIDGLCLSMQERLTNHKWYSLPDELNLKDKFTDDYLPEGYQSQDHKIRFTADRYRELTEDTPLQVVRLPNSFATIAEFNGNEIKIVGDISTFPTSACNLPKDCPVCRQHLDARFSYLHGDILLLGLFSIHLYGDTPFQCGPLRHDTNDAITVSAFMESIRSLRRTTGIAYGGIAIDDCYSAFNTSAFLSDLFSKKTVLRDHRSGEVIDFDKVFVIVGALSSPVSLIVGDLATAVGVPMISYGASSLELDNAARYPLFLRTVPSDTRQAKGIVQLIHKLNVTYVGALYIDDAYGKNGIKAISTEAKALGICIVDPVAISQDTDNATLESIITNLYLQETRVIVYFSIDSLALRILGILSSKFSDRKPLVFIASEAWGTNTNLLQGQLGQRAKGSLVFNVETIAQDNMEFREYLSNLDSSQSEYNRWVPNYFEDVYNCDFISSFEKFHTRNICKHTLTIDPRTVDSLYQDQRGVHVIHAVIASTTGFKQVINEICGQISVCPLLRQKGSMLKEAIQSIKLGGNNLALFDEKGSGSLGFTIFNIQRNNDNGEISYVKIGSFSKNDELTLTSKPIFYNDLQKPTTLDEMFPGNIQCSLFLDRCQDVCHISTEPTPPTSPPSTAAPEAKKEQDSITLVTTVVLAVILAVVGVALVLLIVFLLRRQTQQRSDETFSKSQSLSSHKFPSSTNIYNEVNDYQGSHPRSQFSRFDTMSTVSEGPIQYADIRQRQIPSNIFQYPDPRSELLSTVSTKSLSPGTSRPSKPIVEHTRSKSDSRIMDNRIIHNSAGGVLSPNQLAGFLSPSTRSKGLENLNEINYSTHILNSNLASSNKSRSADVFQDSEVDGYQSPDSDLESQSDFKANPNALNYITAKDLLHHSDEEEDADDISEDSVKYSGIVNSVQSDQPTVNQRDKYFKPVLESPLDSEVMAINFPAKDKVSYSSNTPMTKSNNSHLHNTHELADGERLENVAKPNNGVRNETFKVKTDRRPQDSQKNSSRPSMSSVPDIIPFDVDELRGATSDSDEQEVFII